MKPTRIEASAAEQAFVRVKPSLEALGEAQLVGVRVDLQLTGALAHSIAIRDRAPERIALFERLADAGFYDLEIVSRLADVAHAAWFARQRQLGKAALATTATVPDQVVRESQQIRLRMLKVLEHWFDDDTEIAAECAVIRVGTGHLDLANDLHNLADLYRRPEVADVIARDAKHYRATDVADARRNADTIFVGLGIGQDDEARRWTKTAQRAWTLLSQLYAAHQRAGVFLFGESEDASLTYPSLVAAVRSPAVREQRDVAPAPSTETTPASPTVSPDEPLPVD